MQAVTDPAGPATLAPGLSGHGHAGPSGSLRVAMVAGEASGDLLAALLLGGLRQRWPDLGGQGIGGPAMQAQGFQPWWPHHKLAVRGYVEVLRHYAEIAGIRRQLRQRLLAMPPDVFIGVDAPDFNLDLEQALRQHGVPTVHFISPSIWAWRAGRIDKIRRAVDHMLCIFPFEPAIYERAGVPATYVGHPLAQVIPMEPDRAAARGRLGLPADAAVVAVLPGSRRSEVQYILPAFAGAMARMRLMRPGVQFVLPVAPGLRAQVQQCLGDCGALDQVRLLDGQSHDALAACDVTLIASGTATLEAALFKRPMVIAYRMNALSWRIMRPMALQPWVGLPNILCADFVVPEFLQDDASPDRLAQATLAWLDDPARVQDLARRFSDLHQLLRRDTAAEATHAIEKVVAR